jgi:hypothetical protein
MKVKNNKKILIIASVLTIIFIFSVSAVCNLCGAQTDKTDVEETDDKTPSTTSADVTETTDEDNDQDDATKPTIKLVIYEGPTYEAASDVCFYRIKAEVTGSPSPEVKFSKDDSEGTLGPGKCQVNIDDPGDMYKLTATAKNKAGEKTDELELSWGCEEPNTDPDIDMMETTIAEEKFYINSNCVLTSHATDPDGDSVEYRWEVTGGTLADPDSQNTTWTMPSSAGTYTIKLTVTDGKGGEDDKSWDIEVVSLVYDFMEGAPGAVWRTGSGSIPFGGSTSDNRGFAVFQTNVTLEDGTIYPRVLETHPQWVNNGWIEGRFPNSTDVIQIPAGAKFKAKVGFMDGLSATDGVYFRMRFYDGATWYHFPSYSGIHCIDEGALNDLNIDLSSIAGKSGSLFLQVDAGDTSAQDWAVWVAPVITK